ncbi:hypothetical protein O5D80_007560 [Batrachochytrium dendrobatidis]|nr:hypothetical protein O5D80_007560 [Batrachochytrium dendrobatidis]
MSLVLASLFSLPISHKSNSFTFKNKSDSLSYTPLAVVRTESLFCLAIDSILYLVSINHKQLSAQVELDCRIDCLGVHSSRQIAVVGDILGSIHFVHLLSGQVFYSQALVNPTTLQQSNLENQHVFACLDLISNENTDEVVVSLTSGTLMRLSGIDFALVEQYLLDGNLETISSTIQQHVKVQTIKISGELMDSLNYVLVSNQFIYACGSGSAPLTIWTKHPSIPTACIDSVKRVLNGSTLIFAELESTSGYIATLDTTDQLTLFDSKVWVAIGRTRISNVVDMYFTINPLEDIKTVLVVVCTDQQETRLILLDIPTLDTIQKCNLPSTSKLVRPSCSGQKVDTLELIYVNYPIDLTSDYITLDIQIAKLSPTTSLQKVKELIFSGQLDKAEDMAQANHLDIQSLYKLHIESLLAEMTSGSSKTDLVSDTLLIMNHIEDDFFIVNHCLEAKARSLDDVQHFIEFCRSRLEKSMLNLESSEKLSSLAAYVEQITKRLATYIYLHEFDFAQWIEFKQRPISELIRDAIAVGDCSKALTIWNRHSTDPTLCESIATIFQDLPVNMTVSNIIVLVQEFERHITTTAERNLLNQWIVDRARQIEAQTERPHDALKFLISLQQPNAQLHRIKYSTTECSPWRYVKSMLHDTQNNSDIEPHSSLLEFLQLLSNLKDLASLWDDHNMPISLSVYEKEQPMSIAMSLVDRVAAPELIPSAIEKHIKPYLARHDDITVKVFLSEYCTTLMDSSIGQEQSFQTWEPRVLAIVPLIGDSSIENDIILEIMRRTGIPWSADLDIHIKKRLKDTMVHNHRDIVEQFRLIQLKRMMLKYDITVFNIANMSLAKRLLRHICKQTDQISAVGDALQVVKAYHNLTKMDAYLMRARFLVAENLFERCELLLSVGSETADTEITQDKEALDDESDQRLSSADRASLVTQLLGWILIKLDYAISQQNESTFTTMLQAGIMIHGILTQHHIFIHDLPSSFDFRRAQNLYRDYKQMIHPKCIMDPLFVQTLLQEHIQLQSFTDGSAAFVDIYTYADALGIDRHDTLCRLAILLTQADQLDLAMLLCNELNDIYPGSKTATTFATCCKLILSNNYLLQFDKGSEHIFKLAKLLVQLGRLAIANSDSSDLSKHLDLFKDLDLLYHIVLQGDMGAYRASLTKRRRIGPTDGLEQSTSNYSRGSGSRSDYESNHARIIPVAHDPVPYQDERFGSRIFHSFYHETGLVLNAQTVLEHAVIFVQSTISMNEALAREINDPFADHVEMVGKGKRANDQIPDRQLAHTHGHQLVDICLQHRQYQLAIRLSQRLIELSYSPLSQSMASSNQATTAAAEYILQTEHALKNLATQMLSAKVIDKHYTLACLLSLPTKIAFDSFKSGMATTGKDFGRLERVAKVGAMAGLVWSQHDFQANCQRLAVHAGWWQELQVLEIPFDQAKYQASVNGDYQRELIPHILQKTDGDLETTLAFSQYYHIEDDFVYFQLVKQQLYHLTDTFECAAGDTPKHHVCIASIMTDISNKEKFIQLLINECLYQISAYNYEDIRFINEQILRIDANQGQAKNAILVLDILKSYTRIVPPTFDELLSCYNATTLSTSRSTVPPDISILKKKFSSSYKRLPFHMLIKDPWTVLAPEICDVSLARLVPVCYVLDLDPDKLHLTLISSKIALLKSLSSSDQDTVSVLGIKCADFRSLVSKIRDSEQAVTTAVLVGGSYPCGTDRIAMYKLAIHLAERWLLATKSDSSAEETTNKVEVTIARLKKMAVQAETEVQLRTNKLTEFLSMAHSPLDLCVALYKHGATMSAAPKCDIHDVIEKIAKRSLLKLDDIQMLVLMRLVKLEVPEEDKEQEQDLQNQIHYLFERNSQLGSQLLLRLAYQSSTKVDTWMRVRALSALIRLTKQSDMEEMSKKGVWHYMQMTMYLKEFQDLNIVQSLQDFDQCNKGAFVQSLWLSHRNSVKGLRLICKICIDYMIMDGELLYNVFLQLEQHQDHAFVLNMLETLVQIPSIAILGWVRGLWVNTWQISISNWFLNLADANRAKILEFQNLLSLYIKSPYSSLCHLEQLIGDLLQTAFSLESRFFAIILLGHLPTSFDSRDKTIRNVMSGLDGTNLISLLDTLNLVPNGTVYPNLDTTTLVYAQKTVIPQIMHVLNSRHLFVLLAASQHLESFVKYVVQTDQVTALLLASIKSGREMDAFKVLDMYCAFHGLHHQVDSIAERDNTTREIAMLHCYAETHADELGDDAEWMIQQMDNKMDSETE